MGLSSTKASSSTVSSAVSATVGMSRNNNTSNSTIIGNASVMDDPYAPTPWMAMTSSQKSSIQQSPPPQQQQQHRKPVSATKASNANAVQMQMQMSGNRSSSTGMSASVSASASNTQRRGAMSLSSSPSSSSTVNVNAAMSTATSTSSSSTNPLIPMAVSRSMNASTSGGIMSGAGMSLQQQQQEEAERKKAKEKFLMFTKVLMKYLEAKDQALHQKAKLVIKACAERNKAKDPEYKSLTAAMQTKLRECVGEVYWKKADEYLKHFLRSKLKEKVERDRAAAARQQHQVVGAPIPITKTTTTAQAPAVQQQIHRSVSTPKQQPSQQRQNSVSGMTHKGRATPIVVSKQQQQQQQSKTSASSSTSRMRPPNSAASSAQAHRTVSTTSARGSNKSSTGVSTSKKASSTNGDAQSTSKIPPLPANIMAMLDQNIRYDPLSAAKVLTREKLQDQLSLDQEQKILLYGSTKFTARWSKLKRQEAIDTVSTKDDPFILFRGWDKRNIVSTRIAYARTHDSKIVETKKPTINAINSDSDDDIENKTSSSKDTWVNEELAEKDLMLTLISEATQLYVKKILETAVTLSRKKQNLDGIRIWHLHHVQKRSPPLGLQLGCDVYRQYVLGDADAAGTCRRMEQALTRRNFGINPSAENIDGDDGLVKNATSIVDMSRRIQLPNASLDDDNFVKRKLDTYAGKGDDETDPIGPPFGRVPKKCKLSTVDLNNAYRVVVDSTRSTYFS